MAGGGMQRLLGCVLVLMLVGCTDSMEPSGQPIRLSGTMKVAADSLTVTLRITNQSDTTRVLEWAPDCAASHPATFAIFRDLAVKDEVWSPAYPPDCGLSQAELELAPGASGTIRGFPYAVPTMLEALAPGTYYIGITTRGLTIRPRGGSYRMPVHATVPVGPIELR